VIVEHRVIHSSRIITQRKAMIEECRFISITVDASSLSSVWVCVSTDTIELYEINDVCGKEFATFVVCGNAAGVVLPPLIVYAAKSANTK
jgi:hypothetical protein